LFKPEQICPAGYQPTSAFRDFERLTKGQQFEKARELSRMAGARPVEADSLRSLGIIYFYQGDAAKSQETFEQTLSLYRLLGNRTGECLTLSNLGSIAMQQGDLTHARALFEEGLRAAEAVGDTQAKFTVLMGLGDLEETYLGDFVEARQRYQEILHMARQQRDDLKIAIACSGIGSTSLSLGDLATAEPALLEAARLNQTLERWLNLGWELTGLSGTG
jgi:tetratricopeptide (TPR) repeat protein